MSNRTQGSPGAPQLSYSNPSVGMTPRRSSYASVAAGTASNSIHQQVPPGRSGTFSHLMNPIPSSPAYIPHASAESFPRTSQTVNASESRVDSNFSISRSWEKGAGVPNLQYKYLQHPGYNPSSNGGEGRHGFFKPTYLRGSKYMERLELAYKTKLAAQREAHSTHSPGLGSLSTSSSSVSLHKMAPSHRGITNETMEHQPSLTDDGLAPLPSKWAEADKHGGLEIVAEGFDVKYMGPSKLHVDHEAAAARADHPMPPQCGIYYYEVTIVSKGKEG